MATLYCIGGPMARQPVRIQSPLPEVAVLGPDGRTARYLLTKHTYLNEAGEGVVRAFYVLEWMDVNEAEEIMIELWDAAADPYAE